MEYNYYYNNVPNVGPCRNNLIYTSLISNDQKTFVQWYYNDTDYHLGQNQVVDPSKMDEKWEREVKYLSLMAEKFPMHVPEILEIDHVNRKIYLKIDGPDFWERNSCSNEYYDSVLPDWDDQMIEIIKAHKSLGLHKYSMHPSSYFVVDGKLKSINYFFTYHQDEPNVSISDVESHIHSNRQEKIRENIERMGIDWYSPQAWNIMDLLCWNSFKNNYPREFIERAKRV